MLSGLKQKLFALQEEFTQMRFERPVLAGCIIAVQWIVGIVFFFYFLWVIASTSFGQFIGLSGIKDRIVYGYHGYVWHQKGVPTADSLPIIPQRYRGTIERASEGKLLVSYYADGVAARRLVKLANVVVEDEKGHDEWAKKYFLKSVIIDFYLPVESYLEHDVWSAVLWSSKKPINVELVENNIGTPEINPITTAVNMIFSQWYFQKALGN